ncbi:Bacterial type II secretion system protein F domain protein [Bacillus sp. THAF10]|uniref:type II secretion system F family protein n=1 Tax=Bacillus sp. THAF10 TaxID=2587848 RepID=UPI001268C3CB|nr:type II secretion system F family protein [Bacillus sp. THAF10]QFT88472.1 Bacterial type II secretion system protein F domain protein [Bacillus sp. THAF10]
MGNLLLVALTFMTMTLLALAISMTIFRSSLAMERRVQTFLPLSNLQLKNGGKKEGDLFVILKNRARLWIKKAMKESTKINLEKRLEEAGRPNGWSPADFMLIQFTFSTSLFFLSLFLFVPGAESFSSVLFLSIVLCLFGLFIPNFMLSVKIKKRMKQIDRMMPDFFDLLNLSMEAGMGLDASFQKVSKTLAGPLSDEFMKMMEDMSLGKSRKEAYMLLRERVKIPVFQQAITSLIQADQLGMGLSKTVSILTTRIREQRVFNAREQAMKAPVKMVFPLIFLIFPAIFIVLLGPMVIYLIQRGL